MGPTADRHRFVVNPDDVGLRLDQLLARRVPELSRRGARTLLDLGGVFVDRRRIKVASRRLREGQRVEVYLGGAFERAKSGVGEHVRRREEEALPDFEVVHRDDDVLVVNKPSGLLTAPTPESDRNNLADLLVRREHAEEVRIVHRLDLETSGLLVFALHRDADRRLKREMQERRIQRIYRLVVAGEPPGTASWTEDGPIDGRAARTHFELVRRSGDLCLVEASLETGRQHQIRIHSAGRGLPVLGDPKHGVSRSPSGIGAPRMALHAHRLAFRHPRTGDLLELEADWPARMRAWLAEVGLANLGAEEEGGVASGMLPT